MFLQNLMLHAIRRTAKSQWIISMTQLLIIQHLIIQISQFKRFLIQAQSTLQSTLGHAILDKRAILLVILGLWLSGLQTPRTLWAQDIVPIPTATTSTDAEAEGGTGQAPVKVNGRTILEITDSSAAQALLRADRVHLRLERLIAREEAVSKFTADDILESEGQPLITLGGEPVLTVTLADAENNLMTPQELALMWGGKLSVAVAEARASRANPLQGVGYLIRYSFRDLIRSIAKWLPRLAGAVLVWMVFWVLARLSRWIVQTATERVPLDPNLRQLARAVAFYSVWAAGLMAILSTLGIDSASIATAVGISGFVLGFAFKDILSHFFAGLMLLMGRQFHIGGQIVVGEFEGVVERIELRALHLRTYDNRLVTIPNGDVFTSAVTSNTANPHRRREFLVGIGYREDIKHAQQIAMQTMIATEGVLSEPEPQVLVHEMTSSAVNLRMIYHTGSADPNILFIGSECIRRVKEAFEREGIEVPTEIYGINLRNIDEVTQKLQKVLSAAQQHNANNGNDAHQHDGARQHDGALKPLHPHERN
jgi:small conductance mechanosensitive channel